MKQSLLDWLAGHDTGLSSRAIVAWLEQDATVAAIDSNRFDYPRDPADLGRCIRLLDIEPNYRARITEMAFISPQWARLTVHWAELEALYHEEEPSGKAPICYALMRSLIDRPAPDQFNGSHEKVNS